MTYYFDEHTQSAIGYMDKDSADGWTKAGTWFTYSDKTSIDALVKYIGNDFVKIDHCNIICVGGGSGSKIFSSMTTKKTNTVSVTVKFPL